MNTLRNLAKSLFAHMVCNMFIFLKFEIFWNSLSGALCCAISRKLLMKSRNQNIFPLFKMNPIRC